MNLTLEEHLKRIAALIEGGFHAEAREMLVELVQRNPNYAPAWYLLSKVVQSPQQKADCLRRVLALQPGYAPARAALNALLARPKPAEEPTPPPSQESALPEPEQVDDLEPDDPPDWEAVRAPKPPPVSPLLWVQAQKGQLTKQNMPLLAMVGAFLLVMLLVICGFAGIFTAGKRAQHAQETLQVVHATQTFQARLVLPPTWTLTPSPEVTATPTRTPTRPAQQTPISSSATPLSMASPGMGVSGQLQQIKTDISSLRGLDQQAEVETYLLSRDRAGIVLSEFMLSPKVQNGLLDAMRVTSALGLTPPHYDLTGYVLNNGGDGIGGIYHPQTKVIYLVGTSFAASQRLSYAHEFGHALADQHFRFTGLGVFPYCLGDTTVDPSGSLAERSGCQAKTALVEGDANLVAAQWLAEYATPEDQRDLLSYQPQVGLVGVTYMPSALLQDQLFPYTYGQDFAAYLYERGGWEAVDQAYLDLPASTEQIIHPEKYVRREPPIAVEPLPIQDALGANWRPLFQGVLGEWWTYLLLAEQTDTTARLDKATAQKAAAGWGGDVFQVYYHGGKDHTVLVVQWTWDTANEAVEFRQALLKHQAALIGGEATSLNGAECRTGTGGRMACLLARSTDVLWFTAPDADTMETLLSQ